MPYGDDYSQQSLIQPPPARLPPGARPIWDNRQQAQPQQLDLNLLMGAQQPFVRGSIDGTDPSLIQQPAKAGIFDGARPEDVQQGYQPDQRMSHIFSMGPPPPTHGVRQTTPAGPDASLTSFMGGQAPPPPQGDVGAFIGPQQAPATPPMAPIVQKFAEWNANGGITRPDGSTIYQAPGNQNAWQDAMQQFKPSVPPPPGHTMSIQNGTSPPQTTTFGGAAPPPAAGPQMDLTDPVQRNNAIGRVGMGLPLSNKDWGIGEDGKPLTGLPAMQEAIMAGTGAGLSSGESAKVFIEGEKNKLLGDQIAGKIDPEKYRREELAKFLQGNPGATDKQINDFRKKIEGTLSMTTQGGTGTLPPDQSRAPHGRATGATPPPAPGAVPPPAGPAPVEETNGPRRVQQLEDTFGPSVGGLLGDTTDTGRPKAPLSKIAAALYREDQARAGAGKPGYVKSNADALKKYLAGAYPESQIRDALFPSRMNGSPLSFLNPMNWAGGGEQLRNAMGVQPTEEDHGLAALRELLGYDRSAIRRPGPPQLFGPGN